MTLKKTAWAVAVATTLAVTSLSAHADKKEVVQKILSSQQGALDNMARGMTEQFAGQLIGQTQQIIVRGVPEDKRDATAKQANAELTKYLETTVPVVRASINKLAPTTIGAIYEDKFSEEELKQLHAMLDSPILKRYQEIQPLMASSLAQKVQADVANDVKPKLQTLATSLEKILNTATGGKLSQSEAKPAAKPATKK